MKAFAIGAALMGAALAGPAWSASGTYVDGYYVADADLEAIGPGGKASDEGDGFGVKGQFNFAKYFLATGEWQSTSFDRTDTDVDQLRIGAGAISTGKVRFAGLLEYVNFDFDDVDGDGFGLHGRVVFDASDRFSLQAQAGYVNVSIDDVMFADDTFDGAEFTVGGAYAFTSMIGAFVDFRTTHLTNNGGFEFNTDEVRAGVRVSFLNR